MELIKIFKIIDYEFNGFETTFSKNLIEFLTYIFICRFSFFQSYKIFWIMKGPIGFLEGMSEPTF